jgi:predicted AlkP superfamily phosphohydrolase/phosphomutase
MPDPARRVLIIGLDCAPPEILFSEFLDELPALKSLIVQGIHGPLRSTIPPITVPAWMSMATGVDPGTLGIYGLRNRPDHSYRPMEIASAAQVTAPALWDHLSLAGKQVILVGVPLTYPPRPVNGCLISSFLAPGPDSDYTYPADLKSEIDAVADGYEIDVSDFRTDDKDRLLEDIYRMTRKRFAVTRHLMQARPWDFLMHVEMGTDRIHHGFWSHHDPGHRRHTAESPYRNAIRDYYRYLDGEIADLLNLAGEETDGKETAVIVASDHGAKRIDGGICINEWLKQEGYLELVEEPAAPTGIDDVDINWEKTTAWGHGGYYARIFLNVKGREPQGSVDPESYETVRSTLAERLSALPGPDGRPLDTRVFRPEDIYRTCRGVPPDLIVYFGDLLWRSVGTVGGGSVYSADNDTGPDDANHAQDGVFVLSAGSNIPGGRRADLDILDVAPTVMELMGLPVPADMQGRSVLPEGYRTASISDTVSEPAAFVDETYSEDEKQQVMDRLKALGYL